MKQHLFLAHDPDDLDRARNLHARLKARGYIPWLADIDILPGQERDAATAEAIRQAAAVIACFSSTAVTAISDLHRQIRQAMAAMAERPPEQIYLIPVRFDHCPLPPHSFEELGLRLANLHQADLFEPDGFARLLQALELLPAATRSQEQSVAGGDDRYHQVLEAYEALHAAGVQAAAGANHPAAARVRDHLAGCLEDLRARGPDLEMLAGFPDDLAELAQDIDEHHLGRHFVARPAADVLKMLERFTAVTGEVAENRIDSLEHGERLDELKQAVGEALQRLPSAGLDATTRDVADRTLRGLRQAVGKPRYDPKRVGEHRQQLEDLKADLVERSVLLTEVLLSTGFPNLPTGTVFRDVAELWCPQMVQIPAGTFLMGSPEAEEARLDHEGPQHEVVITRPFALGRYAVTWAEFDHFCDQIGRSKMDDEGWGRARHPVVHVSHGDAEAYYSWLGEVTGVSFQLPTEAMWEYACRAGTMTPFSFGDTITTDQVNYDGNQPYEHSPMGEFRQQTLPVGTLPANPWGLFEMHGNVWEWCADGIRAYRPSQQRDPNGALAHDTERVARGGSWHSAARRVRAAFRIASNPANRYARFGFRCARVQDGS